MSENCKERRRTGGIVPGARTHGDGIIVGREHDALFLTLCSLDDSQDILALRFRVFLLQRKVHLIRLILNQPEGLRRRYHKSRNQPMLGQMLSQDSGIQGSLLP